MKTFPHEKFLEENNIDHKTLPEMLYKAHKGFEELKEDLEHTTDEDRERLLNKLESISNELDEDLEEYFEEQLENNDQDEDEQPEPIQETIAEPAPEIKEEPQPEEVIETITDAKKEVPPEEIIAPVEKVASEPVEEVIEGKKEELELQETTKNKIQQQAEAEIINESSIEKTEEEMKESKIIQEETQEQILENEQIIQEAVKEQDSELESVNEEPVEAMKKEEEIKETEPAQEVVKELSDEEILEGLVAGKKYLVLPSELKERGFKTSLNGKSLLIGRFCLHRGKYDTCYKIVVNRP